MALDRSLPDRAEVVIIGGGVMGASAAFHLAEAGVTDVVLLEADQLSCGSTSKSAGGVRLQFSDEINIALALRSMDAFERFGDRPGADIGLQQVGYLFLLTDPADRRRVRAEHRVAEHDGRAEPDDLGGRGRTAVDAGQRRRRAGRDRSACATATRRPDAVVLGYATAARDDGRRRSRRSARSRAIDVDGGDITGVRTPRGHGCDIDGDLCRRCVVAVDRRDVRRRPAGASRSPDRSGTPSRCRTGRSTCR